MMPSLFHYLGLSFILFAIGVTGVLTRRNIIIVLMSLELVFNSANISLAAFSYYLQRSWVSHSGNICFTNEICCFFMYRDIVLLISGPGSKRMALI